MKHLFIINPAAGSRDATEHYQASIRQHCAGLDYEIYISRCPGDCARRTAEAGRTGEDYRVYACGGDGTLNEVAAGAAPFPNLAITVFPGGSGNDFIKMFSTPTAFRDLEQLLDAREVSLDLIRCNEDYSLNICSVGLDARIGTDVGRYKRIPLLQGFRAYAASTVVNVIRGISEHYAVEINGETIDGSQTMICVCNGQFYGGGFHPAPEADPTDGILEVLLVKQVSRLQVPFVIGKYKSGRYQELPQFVRSFRTDHLRIHCDKPSPVNLDGELRMLQDIDLSIAPEKLRFFYPKAAQPCWEALRRQNV